MLLSLHVKNLALIEEEEISFDRGLNILTGETGAGKSIIIGSVNLALGAKAEKHLIRTGAEYALIEMVFQLDNDRQRELLREMDIEPDEDGCIFIRRRIYPGRSQCYACGETVTTKQLKEIAGLLIDVYGQRENQTLLRRQAQLGILDSFAGEEAEGLIAKAHSAWKNMRAIQASLDEDQMDNGTRLREMDLLAYEIKEIDEAALRDGEDEELENRYRLLSDYRKIAEALQTAYDAAGGEDGSGDNAASLIDRAMRELLHVQGMDTSLDEITSQLQEISDLLSDFNRALTDYRDQMVYDPAEMLQIEERLNLINRLKDKYGHSLEEIRKAAVSRQERLDMLQDYDAQRAKLQKNLQTEKENYKSICGQLTKLRAAASEEFRKKLTAELLDLNFEQVDFRVKLESGEAFEGPDGCDKAVFYISMNPGEAPRPLDEIASGGELSRIMLGLKTVFAGKDDINTFIFDEIDSGISGRTAWKVSEKLAGLAKEHQILCITHLPQIAAMEDVHFRIQKETGDGRTVTHITRLDQTGSQEELARLLGGDTLSESAMLNAEEMKRTADEFKNAHR